MTELSYNFPLAWPKDWQHTPQNQRGYNNGFKPDIKIDEALTYLDEELREFSAETATLSSDMEHIKSPRLRKRHGNEPGVCLKLAFESHQYLIACDRWAMLEHNIYALHLALRQFRSIEKWGVGHLGRILHGYSASAMLSATQSAAVASNDLQPWQQLMGLGPTATIEDANAIYRRRAKLHMDDEKALMDLNLAMEEARKYFGG